MAIDRKSIAEAYELADIIVLLDIPGWLRNYRIIKRWLKQRLGLEKSIYKPG